MSCWIAHAAKGMLQQPCTHTPEWSSGMKHETRWSCEHRLPRHWHTQSAQSERSAGVHALVWWGADALNVMSHIMTLVTTWAHVNMPVRTWRMAWCSAAQSDWPTVWSLYHTAYTYALMSYHRACPEWPVAPAAHGANTSNVHNVREDET
jgi:hypothetical protein